MGFFELTGRKGNHFKQIIFSIEHPFFHYQRIQYRTPLSEALNAGTLENKFPRCMHYEEVDKQVNLICSLFTSPDHSMKRIVHSNALQYFYFEKP